ncbi:uncharacterized protein CPUR_05602 [Claviceps purpurea 20.1]|uniref:Extracellular membrane protein CFEM domain-containing protein n=1 Tax=Claviceps purpurea (strain 20.1) TaxID=1111077 RepID=M1VWR8_CLAP2|nr:uncharacterized protein CPUR_05602 [Claviceps purpurea 20.1]
MGRFLPLFLSLIGTLHVVGVFADSSAECIGRCAGQVRGKFKDLQCADANAAPCLCANPTFPRAILECSQSCGATMDLVANYLSSDFCKAQPLAKPSASAAASPPASSTPSPTTAPATSAAPAASSTSPAETTTSTSPTSTPTPTSTPSSTSSQVESTTSVPPEASSSVSVVTTASQSSAPSSTTEAVPAATSSAAAAAASPSTGLSHAAVAGIGVGIGAAVLGLAGVVICALMKGRNKKPGRNADRVAISKPMPAAGRSYPNREDQYRGGRDGSFEKYGPDIEMTANRYEDMVPRTQPRTMV